MSDASVLSHEYQTASKLSRRINDALIDLKKVSLDLPGADQLSEEQIRESRRTLEAVIDAILQLLTPVEKRGRLSKAAIEVPASLVARLRERRPGDVELFAQDLAQALEHLRRDQEMVSVRDLSCLDQVAAAVDAERSTVFRQMMRR